VPRDQHVQRVVWLVPGEDQREKAAPHLAGDNRRNQALHAQIRQRDSHRVRAGLGHLHAVAEQGGQRVGVVEGVLDIRPQPRLGQRAGGSQGVQPLILHDHRLADHRRDDLAERLQAAILGGKLEKLLADFVTTLFGRRRRAEQHLGNIALDVAQLGRVGQAQQGHA